ncbi:hypothetical protein TNCV_3220991 [Trichonephila clavipes]|nr:hypothetical protein TNCV_3220991 [Trichonephila clavipes]
MPKHDSKSSPHPFDLDPSDISCQLTLYVHICICTADSDPSRSLGEVSAADKGWRVHPLDPRPDAVVLVSLVGLSGGWRHARTKTFLDSPLAVSPHSSLNTSRGVIFEPDLLSQRFLRDSLTSVLFSPKLPKTIKPGYLNCKHRPYISNPLRCLSVKGSDTLKLLAVDN